MNDVIIVGGGPTGALLANLLGQHGLQVLVLDRAQGVMQIPRAVHMDGETMRIFQAAGVAPEIMANCRPGHGMQWLNAAGETLVTREGQAGLSDQNWHNDYYFHQPQVEEALRHGLARYSNVTLRQGIEVRGYTAQADGATLQVAHLADGTLDTVRGRYVVGCDGARSLVRQWIGDVPEDLGMHQGWLVVDAQLHRPLDLPDHTVQHCDPARPATSIYVHPLRRRWEIMLLDNDDLATITEPNNVWTLLERWIKPSQGVLERASCYMFHALVSQTWQQDRLFIAGDAAHQTPPFLGQGLCAGARDAANLAWKLAVAVRTPQRASILHTYGAERHPHAREFVDLAVQMGRIVQVVDPQAAARRDAELKAQGLCFKFPRPTLGSGVHTGRGGPVGKIFIQPTLPDGRWLDDVVGQRFAVLVDASQAAYLTPQLRAELARLDVVLIENGGAKTQQWLHSEQCAAVVIRPDRYVFDAVANLADLPGCIRQLAQWIYCDTTIAAAQAVTA
ncbi:bifunctional 3-(3-hydroxy-phenyl)propionate/3-hydroxycinnamic acid hydroxylase [Janthinobacterium sp. HLX7-2]|uniref:bifunctional 3-(3-hydroxy-phenyl)propionate/3-hydroxycinnamic acid hydroxylase MhpA n=1 Tax=Janthinobacterium sp. HLX7-2 TaxID=1259331 RepID=UPI003F2492ED